MGENSVRFDGGNVFQRHLIAFVDFFEFGSFLGVFFFNSLYASLTNSSSVILLGSFSFQVRSLFRREVVPSHLLVVGL